EVEEQEDHIEIRAPHGLTACVIDFPISTVGGTENALLCACVARGATVIRNAYITPEIKDLINLLRLMGAAIVVHGNSCITVEGRDELSGASLEVTPDRIEALTWMAYAVLSGGSVMIRDVPFSGLEVPLIHFREAGIDLFH